MLHTGVDLHKRTVALATLDGRGRVVQQGKLRTDRDAIRAYFRRLPGRQRATVEATGSWYWLSDLLRDEGVDLQLAHAKFLKAIAYAKVKTDAVDAATLAQLLRADLIPGAHMISPELRELRDLLRARLHLARKDVSARNSVQRLLEKYNVPTPAELPATARLQAGLFQDQSRLSSGR
jgi:transposase